MNYDVMTPEREAQQQAKRGPFQVVKDFEAAVGEYTGAPHVVAVNSCTMALLLAVAWHLRNVQTHLAKHPTPLGFVLCTIDTTVEIPKRTYVSVPMSIIHAGGRPTFRDEDWLGFYRLEPLPVWDCARYFSSGMYRNCFQPMHRDAMVCVSFHASKVLAFNQGGAILHNNPEADAWLRRARFDGRTEGVAPIDDRFEQLGWHCYMSPDVAAGLLLRLHSLRPYNAPLANDDYPDLSQLEIFK